jgi:hypothetical protein
MNSKGKANFREAPSRNQKMEGRHCPPATAQQCKAKSTKLFPHLRGPHNSRVRSRNALLMTDTELKVMAALAIIGLSNSPKIG